MSRKRIGAKEQLEIANQRLKEAQFHLDFIKSKVDNAIDLTEIHSLMRAKLKEIKRLL